MSKYIDNPNNIDENNINNGAVLDGSGYQKPTFI